MSLSVEHTQCVKQPKMDQSFTNYNILQINEQRSKLQEVTTNNKELLEELRAKNFYIEQQTENFQAHMQNVEQKDDIIKMLSEKEEEHTKIIKLLRNNMEIRSNVENDVSFFHIIIIIIIIDFLTTFQSLLCACSLVARTL